MVRAGEQQVAGLGGVAGEGRVGEPIILPQQCDQAAAQAIREGDRSAVLLQNRNLSDGDAIQLAALLAGAEVEDDEGGNDGEEAQQGNEEKRVFGHGGPP